MTRENLKEYSVSEISQAVKSTVEGSFSHVLVKGEISGFKRASSGHIYFSLKDENAVLNAICWRGTAEKLAFSPEDGLEVVVTGKISTYPGRSNYQIIAQWMEPAGAGALMALLEKRKKELAREGLFDAERKKELPYMPSIIGVVTSPTGAVIRDILHRIGDRFPVHVIVWPVLVQGEGAAEQIAGAIEGFNSLPEGGNIPRPNLLIIARGGGSLEDLWAFNEEIVIRAAAESKIPLISAVGHETDTTLIDFVSDKRAPTPTAAAEMAVPVRSELLAYVYDMQKRLFSAINRMISERDMFLKALVRGLISPKQLIDTMTQRLDDWSERLSTSMPNFLEKKKKELRLISLGFTPQSILRVIKSLEQELASYARLLESYHYKKVLARGFALVRRDRGKLVTSASEVTSGMELEIEFNDGKRTAIAAGTFNSAPGTKKTKKNNKKDDGGQQDSLF